MEHLFLKGWLGKAWEGLRGAKQGGNRDLEVATRGTVATVVSGLAIGPGRVTTQLLENRRFQC